MGDGIDPIQYIKDVQVLAADYGMPVGVVLFGYDYPSDAEYAEDVLGWSTDVPTTLQHYVVQSWATRTTTSKMDLPRNLGQGEADSHTGILGAVMEMVR